MKVEFEPEGNTTFIFPYNEGVSSEGAFEILKALHENRVKHLQ